jgi:hypothetical protein
MLVGAKASVGSLLCCLALAGCSDNKQQPPCCDWGTPIPDIFPSYEGSPPPGECTCKETEVCDSNKKCVPKPVPTPNQDVVGEVTLEHYVDPVFATMAFTGGAVGRSDATFYVEATPPWSDPRSPITTAEGDTCYIDNYSCDYPHCNNDQVWLPPGLDAGALTFTITGAPGVVALTSFNAGGSGKPDDWMYGWSNDKPGPLKDGSTTYSSWIDKSYVPLGAKMRMDMAGGADFNAQSFPGLEVPAAFTIDSPRAGQPVPSGQPLKISWSPPQPGALMRLEIVGAGPIETAKAVSCSVRDDGSVTIPATAVTQLGGVTYITFKRDVVRYWKTTTKAGKVAHLYLAGRNGIGYKVE